MANVAHSTLTGSNLHENKGVAAADDDTVATADTGATVWQKLTVDHLTGTGKAFQGQLYHVQDQKVSGNSAGNNIANAWTKRDLNTEVTDQITSSTLISSVISLPAGTYYTDCAAVFGGSAGGCKIRLRNTTDSTTLALGLNTNGGGASVNLMATCSGQFTLAGTKNVELQYWTTNASVNGLGAAASSGEVEVYADAKIWKIG